MRFLAWHVDYVTAKPTEKGRSTLVEDANPVKAENALLVFANFEKSDETHQEEVIAKAADEIAAIAAQLKVTEVVLNPFAHLFAEPAQLDVARDMLDGLRDQLLKRDFTVMKLAFGMFYEIELRAKGHRLSRIARTVV